MAAKKKALKDKPIVSGNVSATVNLDLFGTPLGLKLYKTARDIKGSGFNNGCPECNEPISMPKTCAEHGPCESVVKIVQSGGQNILITEEDMELLELPTAENFVVESCVPVKDIENKLAFSTNTYYLIYADSGSKLVYSALYENLKKSKKALLGKFTLRSSRELFGAITVLEHFMILRTLPFAENAYPHPKFELAPVAVITEGIGKLLEAFPDTFDYESIQDNYGIARDAMIAKKIEEKLRGVKAPRKKKVEKTESPDESAVLRNLEASLAAFRVPAKA